jgi:hypothetical protein
MSAQIFLNPEGSAANVYSIVSLVPSKIKMSKL